MRTKTLVLSALVGLATAATSMAQVYSLNVVGYVNVTLTNGFNLIANPLDFDGTNKISTIFGTNLPQGSVVYTYVNGGYATANWNTNKSSKTTPIWDLGATNTCAPGQGIFVKIPAAATINNFTFVGNVVQGAVTNKLPAGAGGFAMLSSIVPVAGSLTNLGYVPTQGDIVYTYKNGYVTYPFNTNKSSKTIPIWTAGCPTIGVGEGFYLKSGAAGEKWTNYFIVQ